MNNYDKIPIQNIYYMFCYAKNRLEEKDIVDVSQKDYKNLYDLLSEVLYKQLAALIKKGFYREYKSVYEETQTLKGKINFDESLKKNSLRMGRAYCTFDEFDYNIIHNQIIKATMVTLLKYGDLRDDNRNNLKSIYHYFNYITTIKLDNRAFENAKIHKNNANYGFILDICRLVYDGLLIDETVGNRKFKDFIRDERTMAYIFEEFVRNFYKKELPNTKVYRKDIRWDTTGEVDSFLPIMTTDIMIEREDTLTIMDTKFYKEPLAVNYGQEKIKINNLYQIYGYVMNIDKSKYKKVTGALLYPMSGRELNLKYCIGGYDFWVVSVDLMKSWKEIHDRLLDIVEYLY